MALPFSIASLPTGNNPGSVLDSNFNAVGAMAVTFCTAVGTNAITLTAAANQPPITSPPTNGQLFSFSAASTSTGSVTVATGGGSQLPLYLPGAVQAISGQILASTSYIIQYLTALNSGAGGYIIVSSTATILSIPRGYIGGLVLSNDGTTPNTVLDVSAGQAADNANAIIITLAAFTKSTGGVWAAGSGNNGMGTGLTIANSTWYHVFAIINAGVADIYFDTDPGAANKPASTTSFRRIGSFKTDTSAHILAFTQRGDDFTWNTVPALDVSNVTLGTSATDFTLPNVPLGIISEAKLGVGVTTGNATATANVYPKTSVDQVASINNLIPSTVGVSVGGATSVAASAHDRVFTDTSQRVRAVANGASTTFSIAVLGWVDTRGRLI